MELILNEDPLEKLKRLLDEASALPGNVVSHISVSRAEMKAIVTHSKAGEVIFDYINPQKQKLQRVRDEMTALRRNQEHPTTALPQQEFFDALDVLEKREMDYKDVVPKQFNQNGIIIKATIK